MFYGYAPYVPVAERRRQAAAAMARLAKSGHVVSPVVVEGRAIATTVWGKAWCANLEAYSDYANRLPRGRTYVRNGSVVDLQIAPGRIEARVSGSSLYRTSVTVTALPKDRWETLCGACAGGIDSLVELLQGRFATGVMERLCRRGDGLFPTPKEIRLSCSCPDGARMCKHVAAVLYGIGARLDRQPELLFTLRQVTATDLLAKAGSGLVSEVQGPSGDRTLAADEVGALFGLEMEPLTIQSASPVTHAPVAQSSSPPRPARTGVQDGAVPVRRSRPTLAAVVKPAAHRAPKSLLPFLMKQDLRGPEFASLRKVRERLLAERARDSSAEASRQARKSRPVSSVRPGVGEVFSRLRNLLLTQGSITNVEAREATDLDAADVRVLLRRLVAEGHARVEGQKRGTRYVAM